MKTFRPLTGVSYIHSPRGLLYGVGKFLRTSHYDGGVFRNTSWHGVSAPDDSLRGMYFAPHFHNWYDQAPELEIERYLEDRALCGVNLLKVSFPMISLDDWNDPQADVAVAILRKYGRAAKKLGMLFAIGAGNTSFINTPEHIRATPLSDPLHRRGNSGHLVCPSIPEGRTYILNNYSHLYEQLSYVGLDVLRFWHYGEGGWACEKCSPWASNGYLSLSRDTAALARIFFPGLKTVVGTWTFDTPPSGELQGLDAYMKTDGEWIDYILADSHEDSPRYPLDVGVSGNRPLLNFPEISMWGNKPWGGYGANPLPGRFQRLWNLVKHIVQEGYPYSEGIYEDMNKAIITQFYWNPG